MLPRPPLSKIVGIGLLLAAAVLTVGLTASADGPFSIAVRPVFLRLGLDVDVKLGTLHLHAGWSALDPDVPTTKPALNAF